MATMPPLKLCTIKSCSKNFFGLDADIREYVTINAGAGNDSVTRFDGNDTLKFSGGAGQDVFVVGKTHGSNLILNASSADVVHFNNATLSDIISLDEINDTIMLSFNTGNAVNVQSSEATSAEFLLADGSAYRYEHSTGSQQTN